MIYISASLNDFQKNLFSLQENIEACTKAYRAIKEEVTFIIGDNGDQILEYCGGLEDFSYLYSRGSGLFAQLHDLRFDLESNSIILEQANLNPKTVIAFYQKAQNTELHSDFLRLQDKKHIYGLYFMGKKVYHKLWSIASGQALKASHFSWQSLPMDVCINPGISTSNSYTKELL